MEVILNSYTDAFGPVAVFKYYKDGKEIPHFARTGEQGMGWFMVYESNFERGEITSRKVSFKDRSLVGFLSF